MTAGAQSTESGAASKRPTRKPPSRVTRSRTGGAQEGRSIRAPLHFFHDLSECCRLAAAAFDEAALGSSSRPKVMKHDLPTTWEERTQRLRACRADKMAASVEAYVRGSADLFYDWIAQHAKALPGGPAIWISGDCHHSNLGPPRRRRRVGPSFRESFAISIRPSSARRRTTWFASRSRSPWPFAPRGCPERASSTRSTRSPGRTPKSSRPVQRSAAPLPCQHRSPSNGSSSGLTAGPAPRCSRRRSADATPFPSVGASGRSRTRSTMRSGR